MEKIVTPIPHMNKYPEAGSKEMRRKIGEELRSAREYLQLSIEQIAAKTRINPRFINSIEEGDWSFLPSTYITAFIQSLSETVDLQSKIIEQHLKEDSSKNLAYTTSESTIKSVDTDGYTISGLTSWLEQNRSMIFFAVVALIIVILGILYLTVPDRSSKRFLKQSDTSTQKAPDTTSTSEISHAKIDTVKTTAKVPVKQITPTIPASAVNEYSLVIYAEDTCYIKVQQTDSLLYERTLWPGNKTEVNPYDAIKVSLGNAPGAILILEGDTLERFPEGRRVRVCRIDENGYVR